MSKSQTIEIPITFDCTTIGPEPWISGKLHPVDKAKTTHA